MAVSNIKVTFQSDIQRVWETVTAIEPYKRWEFDMENGNMKGHWIGVFAKKRQRDRT